MKDLKVKIHLYLIWFYYNMLFYKDKGKLVCFSRIIRVMVLLSEIRKVDINKKIYDKEG